MKNKENSLCEVKGPEFLKLMGKQQGKLADNEKQKYVELQRNDRIRYNNEMSQLKLKQDTKPYLSENESITQNLDAKDDKNLNGM